MFIFAVFGMNFFMYVKHTGGLDDMFNFETFGRSMILLFQISTSAGWDSALAGIMNDKDCNPNYTVEKPIGDCGNSAQAVIFMMSYLVISFLVVINMYIAVILENFSQATEDVQQGLTQEDFDMYYETWEKFDEKATQYIPLSRLSEFVSTVEDPLRLPEPNYYELVFMDIPICEDEKVHCVDILDALTKNFLGTSADTGDLGDIKKGPERKNYNPISSTLKRQREIVCAKIVQRTWRAYAKRRRESRGEGGEDAGGSAAAPTTIITIHDTDADNQTVKVDMAMSIISEEQEDDVMSDGYGGRNRSAGAESQQHLSVDDCRTIVLLPDSGSVA